MTLIGDVHIATLHTLMLNPGYGSSIFADSDPVFLTSQGWVLLPVGCDWICRSVRDTLMAYPDVPHFHVLHAHKIIKRAHLRHAIEENRDMLAGYPEPISRSNDVQPIAHGLTWAGLSDTASCINSFSYCDRP